MAEPEEVAIHPVEIPVISVAGLQAENERLGSENERLATEVRRLGAENALWRELIVEMREKVVLVFQGFPHSKAYKHIRKCLAHPDYLAAEAAKILARDGAER
jgi:hypothetical protein